MQLRLREPLDLWGTLRPLRAGPGDPCMRLTRSEVVRATRTPEGPATLQIQRTAEDSLRVRAWGPGSDWARSRAEDLLGLREVPVELPDAPRAVQRLGRLARGLRLARTHRVVELLVLVVLEQLVSGKESARAFRNLVRFSSEPAPGPFDGLLLPLGSEQLRALPPACFPPLGIGARQGETLRQLGWRARRVEEADAMPHVDAERRLLALQGIGPWSAGSALLRGMGHADAVPLGDWNLASVVAFNLAGEERADDARMLELLESCRGQRGRVIRWILAAGRVPPRRAPRAPVRGLPPEGRALLRELQRRS